MKPLRNFVVLVSFFIVSFRTGDYNLIKSFPINGTFLTTDHFSNCYLISDNQLMEYDSTGKYLANYSDKDLGGMYSIDASNPMKLQLFYRDFGQIVTLDNKLAFTTKINLRDLDIQQPIVMCNSYNDAVWVYDQQDFQLKRIESTAQISQASGNISQVLGYDLKPIYMVEDNKWLYMNDPESGIIIFDYYGSYYKTIPIKNIVSFQIIDNRLVYYKENKFISYDMKSFEEKNISLPNDTAMTIYPRLEKRRLYMLEKGKVALFSF